MKRIWNLANRISHGKHSVGAFLIINIVFWIAAVFLFDLFVCFFAGSALKAVLAKAVWTAVLLGMTIGIFGGIIYLMRIDL